MVPFELRILLVFSNKEWQASYRARKIESGNSNTYFEFLKTCWVRMDSMEIHSKWNMRIPWNALKHPKWPKKGWKVLERNVFKKLQFRKNRLKQQFRNVIWPKMTLILCRESIVNLRISWTLGALYILLKFIFSKMLIFRLHHWWPSWENRQWSKVETCF